ncbi:hypothetical protein SLEP1_g23338 [Rubroshorea leprosula]|uniref:SAP domain-containing protein n=1 Tax=Rubroshorea leprosula TaxID=152421 RepID=A0AAV5JKU3_9ROSI|nr:hypothetical protein SLEP1_g23338 [Rubroshorea leprosula]
MSSQYPILDNRPIDQWKVTELKEELKRRRLTISGLKADLVKRLDDSLRIERELAEKDVDNGLNHDPKPVVEVKYKETTDTVESTVYHGGNKTETESKAKAQVDINESAATALGQVDNQGDELGKSNAAMVEQEPVIRTTILETKVKVTETVVSEVALSTQVMQNTGNQGDLKSSKPQLENEHPKLQLVNEDPKPQLEKEDTKTQLESEGSKPQQEREGLKPSHSDDMRDSPPNSQVSEVSPTLGFQVKSDSISTDSVSINEKIELKDNIIADNVKLELDIVKPEMVEPSSSNVVPVSGEAHPMDVEEPLEKKTSVEEGDDKNTANADLAYSEKLNLDRSSGDDSMEEDVLETKQVDSKCNTDEVGNKIDKNVGEEGCVDVVGDGLSAEKREIFVENRSHPVVPAEKRKLQDQEAAGNNEPSKRRRWNSENIKVPELQGQNHTPTTTPKDAFQPPALKRNFSRSDSTASDDAPKERVVPPSQKPPTTSLRIDRFLRPFTLKAVQELLGKTGTVTSFWMDHIKTHCYVTYSSVEEAIETRNAVYNLQWPPNGGRLLVAEFVEPQEVKTRLEAPPQTPTTPGASKTAAPTQSTMQLQPQPQPSPRQQVSRQQLPPPSALPPPPSLSNPPPVRERLPLPPPPPEKLDPPIVTLDDLFRKTKATPRIYYLPLSEEQVAAKLAARGKNTKQ